ncbi:MAG: asparagine synthase (glutamine-hydrolyzing) [Gemmatimonadaceae bacterium]
MCGICGAFAFQQEPDPRALRPAVADLTVLVTRRGPDDEGIWADDRCALGFRRLAILDLSPTGHQPMLTPDGRFALVFNGEVYNFRDIRGELEQRGVRFRSTGDAEVVLYALAEWGPAALRRFNGMFALALYDAVDRRLLLARDHAGIKPLYYRIGEKGVVFGSQFDQILRHPWAGRRNVDLDGLSLYLRFGYVPAPHSMLEGARALDAGSWITIDERGRTIGGDHFRFASWPAPSLRGEAAVDALEAALSGAVARHLISDVPVGVFLSGGVDSPLVASEARRQAGRALSAFTIGVEDPSMDESAAARQFAGEFGLCHVLRAVTPADALSMLESVVDACSEPTADFSIIPTMMVSQLAREHVKVVLSGDGGDELFWGYPERFGAAIEQATYFGAPRPARYAHIAARKYLGVGRATRDVLWPSVGRMYQKKHTILAERDLSALFPWLRPVPSELHLFECDTADPDEAALWVRWNEFRLHLARVLLKVDRASMFHSLEVRVPLLDKDVIAVALDTDWRSCLAIERRRGKIPLREALRRRVPFQVDAKKGFTVPMHDWLAGPLQPLLREKVLGRTAFLGMEANRARLDQLNRRLLEGQSSVAWGLWLLLSLALWEDRHWSARPTAGAA